MTRQNPCVLIGVTGCIAAYKTCLIIRELQRAGVRCKVVMTEHATEFVGPTTFRALTREPVAIDLFDNPGDPIHHISLAQECDLFLIAPCTANVVAKVAHGIADDLLTTTALATKAPLVIAPAMNVGMYEAAATQDNFNTLLNRGVHLIDAASGYQACGDVGKGRMAEPEDIVRQVLALLEDTLGVKRDLLGKRVMITAGPTVEPIDAVRYISNHSSGKMGYAIADAAQERGASVVVISGPVGVHAAEGVEVVKVQTACEMLDAASSRIEDADIAIFSAAVADVRPAYPAERKLKKGADDEFLSCLHLIENPDILKTLASRKRSDQFIVGFAAETDDVIQNAKSKLAKKNADMIVANYVGEGLVFGSDENQAALVTQGSVVELPSMSKYELAHRILDEVLAVQAQL